MWKLCHFQFFWVVVCLGPFTAWKSHKQETNTWLWSMSHSVAAAKQEVLPKPAQLPVHIWDANCAAKPLNISRATFASKSRLKSPEIFPLHLWLPDFAQAYLIVSTSFALRTLTAKDLEEMQLSGFQPIHDDIPAEGDTLPAPQTLVFTIPLHHDSLCSSHLDVHLEIGSFILISLHKQVSLRSFGV